MAKQWKSLWDDYDGEGNGPDEAKQPRGPRPNPHYRGEIDAADDELASDEYGGFGWSGKFSGDDDDPSYRYADTLDDSDERWYRKNSFRYGKHADYSPSSLFRSAFSRSYSYSGGTDNEATNKAIRALRNLTRSANTIVDKSAGSNPFAVQFSTGADSNGTLDTLNDDKQRVVFVSPDELLETKTTEDEDSVVDALTGFVLLRVQMAQDVARDVITRINNTGAQLAATRVAAHFAKPGVKPLTEHTADELRALSGAAIDEYLAGMLAKSVLMRLARRKVVQNWGGFAPYFIRHAKKFAAVKAKLEAAALSAESVVGTLGYNMLADEEPIAIDKAFEDIATKHLGEEVPMAQLLPACRRLVDDIRAALVSAGGAVPGEMEEALNEMLDKAQTAQKAGSKGSNPLKDFLEQFGSNLMSAKDAASEMASECASADTKAGELADKLRGATSAEQLLKKLTAAIEKMSEMIADTKSENPAVVADAGHRLMNVRNNINYLLQSRPQAMRSLLPEVTSEADAIAAACQPSKTTVTEAEAKALQAKVEEFLTKAARLAKRRREELKKEAIASIAGMQERTERLAALAAKLHDSAIQKRDELARRVGVSADHKDGAITVLDSLASTLNQIVSEAARWKPVIDKSAATVNTARSASTLEKAHKSAQQAMSGATRPLQNVASQHYNNWHFIAAAIRQFLDTLAKLRGVLPRAEALAAATEEALSRKAVSPAGFAAAMAKAAGGSAFANFISGSDDDEEEEDDSDSALSLDASARAKIQQLLETLSLTGLSTAEADTLGKSTADKLQEMQAASSPVDGELFGDAISAKTKILNGDAIGRVNDEARNDPEEEYIAYLNTHNGNGTTPKVRMTKEGVSSWRPNRTLIVKEVRAQHRGSIERVKNALQFQSGKRTAENFGLRSGDLDEGSLHKLGYDCDNIWSQKTVSKLPDVAVGILVDQSGSMSGQKITNARTMCIILAEALKRIAGVRLYVYGHTANNGEADLTIYEHYTPTSNDITNLGGISAHSNNYDGYAIKDVAKRLALDSAKKKYLFVIADGLPCGHGYGGETAEKHVTSVCKFVRDRLKIGVNAFAVGVQGYQQAAFKRQYGNDHVVFIDNIMKCLPQIVRFLRNALQKERKLVGVED